MSDTGDMWRVDVAGYPVSVRGLPAKDHLERVNNQLARMKMALYRIAKICDVTALSEIAREELHHD